MRTRIWRFAFVALGMAVVAGAGCSKITRGNYEMVKPGMTTEQELAKIMGLHEWSPSEQEMKIGGVGQDIWWYRQGKQGVDIYFYIDRETRVVAAKEWEPWPGALSYRLQISVPNGWAMSIDLQKTSQTRYMQTLPAEGTYVWKVTALDTQGEPICCSSPFTFKKQGSTTSSDVGGEPSDDKNFSGG